MALTFDTAYGDTPTAALDQNQRDWLSPIVDRMFRQQSIWNGMVRFYQNLGAVNAKTMTITEIGDLHPNFDTIGLRDIWMPASYLDSRSLEVTFSRYGGKVAYHEYDDIITYWKVNGAASGWSAILQSSLGQHIIDVHDLLIRNQYLTLPFQTFSGSAAADFGDISSADVFDPDFADEVWLGMGYRDVPLAMNPNLPNSNGGSVLCFTTPGVVYDIQKQVEDAPASSKFINRLQYADPARLLNYEIGMLRNTRYIQHPRNTLWNCGVIDTQTTIDETHTAGDGAPDPETTKVDSVYRVGQKAVKHYIGVASETGFAVGDIVTIHLTRTSDFGVSNGVDFREGTAFNRRVVAVSTGKLQLDWPILIDFDTEVSTGVYGYVTKGRHIHPTIFVAGPDAVIAGVGRPIKMHAPAPVDDFGQIFRFSWNEYMGLQAYRPTVAEVRFSAGSTRYAGATSVS